MTVYEQAVAETVTNCAGAGCGSLELVVVAVGIGAAVTVGDHVRRRVTEVRR